ncbi:MAG TPA: GTP 3',8-cyclase MoaA [Geomobilimonas sp.]|nr:GTP 3',8-cyclase MoaA [Geomobilimonas sp.]
MPLRDSYGRPINYLRLSITDSCNLKCLYCVPATGCRKSRKDNLLSYDELLRLTRAAVGIGVEKVRVTGGEPLCRPGITPFLEKLGQIEGLKKLVLTTNGILLEEMAEGLKDAGVSSLNISLDSLRPERFFSITRGGDLKRVLRGIGAAERVGIRNIKINVVMMRGVNDDELFDFAALTRDAPYKIRFIEYMPTLNDGRERSLMVPGEELLTRLTRRFVVEKVAKDTMDGPAVYYRIAGARGEIGLITPVSCHFCHECNRIRVTSSGMLKTCLFDNGVMNLKPFLGEGGDGELQEVLRRMVSAKPRQHSLHDESVSRQPIAMSCIGG